MVICINNWSIYKRIKDFIKEVFCVFLNVNKIGFDFKKMFFERLYFDDFVFSVFWEWWLWDVMVVKLFCYMKLDSLEDMFWI